MSKEPLEELIEQLRGLNRAPASLDYTIPEPFMPLSFQVFSVIPGLRLADMGLVDVKKFDIVPLFVEN